MSEFDTVLEQLQDALDRTAQQTQLLVSALVTDPVTGAMVEIHGCRRPALPHPVKDRQAMMH